MRQKLIGAALALALAGCSSSGGQGLAGTGDRQAEWPGVPADRAERIAALGNVIDPASFAIFADLVDAPPYDDVTVASNLAFGTDPLQKLDVYTLNAAPPGNPRPVLLFVHGGGFTGGSKAGNGYYPQNVTAWAARNGYVGVNIDYRLAPAAAWPAGRDDLAAAINWVRANITQYGGDPENIVLWGHSAGASHVADYVSHLDLQGAEAASVTGAILLSPAYPPQLGDAPHPYYGTDARLQTQAPAIDRLGATRVPLLLAYAEHDPQQFLDFARAVQSELCVAWSRRNCPQAVYLPDHNHLSEGASVGSVDQSLSGPVLQWLRGL
jgi:triacylglycerol lipase